MRITRQATLDAAFQAHPKRFKSKSPQPPTLPTAAWINPSQQESTTLKKPRPCTEIHEAGCSKIIDTFRDRSTLCIADCFIKSFETHFDGQMAMKSRLPLIAGE
jgi:hypothetical protein